MTARNPGLYPIAFLSLLLGGCALRSNSPYATPQQSDRNALRSNSPYATPQQSDRNALKAQELTHQAAELVESDPQKAQRLLQEALRARP
jgi:hypothetical protein